MKLSDFLKHHGIISNPFAEEDAQSDIVFQNGCLETARHPAWDKIFGDPELPSTSIVFGEKGSGKTALKIQMNRQYGKFNQDNSGKRDFVIQYDDFNPFLDAFQERFSKFWRKPATLLKAWKLWDHIDAILTLGVTKLTDQALQVRDANGNVDPELNLKALDDNQKRDFLLLAALYDQSPSGGQYGRWTKLRKKLGVYNLAAWKWFSVAAAWLLLFLLCAIGLWRMEVLKSSHILSVYFWLALFIGFIPWIWRFVTLHWEARKLWKNLRVRNFDKAPMRQILMDTPTSQLTGQPLPTRAQSDDRYALLEKFSNLTKVLGYKSVVVLVDRV
ncbi:MAG: hypothetical protein IKS45_08445, partial [Thermoguttaceae bacterium]|nr:hypothetical protein [Thermoguttaceae bacterium]